MTGRHHILFIAALIAGASYYLIDHRLAPGMGHATWKGAGVGLLALWAALLARARDGWLLAAVMALGAAGDVLLDVAGFTVGGAAFLAGHIAALALYLPNRRAAPSVSQRGLALSLLIASPTVAWLLTRDAAVTAYAVGLGAMAASAWLSRFPRYRVGVGAALFVASDWLIFARGGALSGSVLPDLLIWPAYFIGQALIAWGVVAKLERDG